MADQKTESTESNVSIQSTSLNRSVVRECRICYKRFSESEVRDGLVINPCNCQGIYAFAHNLCINERLEMNGHTSCDICRFAFVMKRSRKGFCAWVRTLPRKVECLELLIRWINVLNIVVIWLIALNYSHYRITRAWKCFLWAFPTFRALILIYLTIGQAMAMVNNYAEWSRNNFWVRVKPNPNYKEQPGYHKSKSPSRVSGSFCKKNKDHTNRSLN